MKTLYIECNMGAAGDMLLSALYELLPEQDKFIEKLNHLHIPSVKYELTKASRCGIMGTHIDVTVNGETEDEHMHEHHHHHHEHHHSKMADIEHIIHSLAISESVKENAVSVYHLIAEAESVAHGRPVSDIHFHEVGTMDAVADVVGVCMAMDELKADKIIVSPINVGSGTVKCAHGILPVPAPATAYILRDVPIYSGEIKAELCTPTGAALLKHFADKFGNMPPMSVSKIGYGMGTKDLGAANCVRVMLGETEDKTDTIAELRCNIDDMTGEEIGYAVTALMNEGALDVFTTPVGMKKNRPGILLTCICKTEEKQRFAELLFKHTTTLGIRENICNRYVLKRTEETTETEYGSVRVKHASGYGVNRSKVEYEDLVKLAEDNNMSLRDMKSKLTEGLTNA